MADATERCGRKAAGVAAADALAEDAETEEEDVDDGVVEGDVSLAERGLPTTETGGVRRGDTRHEGGSSPSPMPQLKTNVDSPWKCAMMTNACTSSPSDQLSLPFVSFCTREPNKTPINTNRYYINAITFVKCCQSFYRASLCSQSHCKYSTLLAYQPS